MKDKNVKMGLLNDYYGGLLTKYQGEIVHLYHNLDMSLAEIGEEYNITRQAVGEVLSRAQKKLIGYEQKLGLVKKIRSINKKLKNLLEIDDCNTIKQELEKIIIEVRDI